MARAAVLLMDLQRDFLDSGRGRMPVDRLGAEAVLRAANDVLAKRVLVTASPVLVLNRFPVSARIGNFFRHGAAVAGTAGAELDDRVQNVGGAMVIAKSNPSAFSNPELDRFLRSSDVRELFVLGVFAEGCVRSTVLDGVKRGYKVFVIEGAIASNAAWKWRLALWVMKRAGAVVIPSLDDTTFSR